MNGTYFDQMKQCIPNLNNLLNIIISAIHSLVNILLMYILKGTCKDSIKQGKIGKIYTFLTCGQLNITPKKIAVQIPHRVCLLSKSTRHF